MERLLSFPGPTLARLRRIGAHAAVIDGLIAFQLTGSPLPALALLAAPLLRAHAAPYKDH